MIEIILKRHLKGQSGLFELDIDMQLKKGGFYALMGESGVGKTSVLKIIAGLMKAGSGKITYEQEVWFDSDNSIFVKPQKRSVGFVFQDYALFPNMSVIQNLYFAIGKVSEKKEIDEILELMNLGDLVKSKPQELSGGQQQRVALARVILRKPDIVLLDEPLAALDQKLREKLQKDLQSLHHKYGFTALMVTHDELEATRLADEVFIMELGKVIRKGTPKNVLNTLLDLNSIEAEILDVDFESNELTATNHRGIFKVNLSESQLKNIKVGQMIKLNSKDWKINE
ncbi:MAG: ABC transporter ATP-binding protein [Bacteroidetes bacterium]|nr:ABC transporter ATP-binding protein [Bacteroidota bacterium]MDA1120023.1 ABC transporter ATP-binding protein [Bacteroidota bacterium]